jgi:FtsZ-binding cell division protein ZapB
VTDESLVERLTRLEEAVRRAADAVQRLKQENADLRREVKRLGEERRQVLGQVDLILKDIARLDLEPPA